MPTHNLLTFPSDVELAAAAAERFVSAASQRKIGPYCVALSGGRIARGFCSAVVERTKSRPEALSAVHFFWGDERCVPPNDPESNYGMAAGLLLTPLNIPEDRIHRVHGEDAPEVAAAAAEAELRRITSSVEPNQPILDLVLLGMGEDGHVASLFPGELEAIMTCPATFRAVTAVKPPPRRLTLGYGAITTAREVWVMASGPGKERALKESLLPGGKTPLARVLSQRAETNIFTDIRV